MVSVQSRSAATRDPIPPALLNLDPHASRLAVLRVGEHHVGEVDRTLLLDHATDLLCALRARHLLRTLVALDHVQPFHVHPARLGLDAQHLAALAAILAADHDDFVVGFDTCGHESQSTSGARETIFIKLRSRNSRATGPKIRVPRGLFWASISTAAFSSNAM